MTSQNATVLTVEFNLNAPNLPSTEPPKNPPMGLPAPVKSDRQRQPEILSC